MIQHIVVKNFKSIKNAETRLPQHVSALVGLNGVGKTNLIQAINFVRTLVIGKSTSAALEAIALTPKEVFNFNEEKSEIFIGITVSDLDENKYLFEVTISLTNQSGNIQNLAIQSEALYKYSHNDEKEIVYKREELKLVDKNNTDIPLAVEAEKVALSLYQQRDVLNVRNIFSNIFIPDQDTMDFRESIVKAGDKGLAGMIVYLRQKDISSFDHFITIVKKLLPTFSTVIELSTTTNPNQTPENERPYMVLLEEANLNGRLSVKSLSAGDLRTLYMIASVMNLKPGSTFIVEEVENGLHPNRLARLLDHLEMISVKKDIQIIYSTHSPLAINKLKAEDVIFVEKDTPQGTRFHLLSDAEHIGSIKKLLADGVPLAEYMYSRMMSNN